MNLIATFDARKVVYKQDGFFIGTNNRPRTRLGNSIASTAGMDRTCLRMKIHKRDIESNHEVHSMIAAGNQEAGSKIWELNCKTDNKNHKPGE